MPSTDFIKAVLETKVEVYGEVIVVENVVMAEIKRTENVGEDYEAALVKIVEIIETKVGESQKG